MCQPKWKKKNVCACIHSETLILKFTLYNQFKKRVTLIFLIENLFSRAFVNHELWKFNGHNTTMSASSPRSSTIFVSTYAVTVQHIAVWFIFDDLVNIVWRATFSLDWLFTKLSYVSVLQPIWRRDVALAIVSAPTLPMKKWDHWISVIIREDGNEGLRIFSSFQVSKFITIHLYLCSCMIQDLENNSSSFESTKIKATIVTSYK